MVKCGFCDASISRAELKPIETKQGFGGNSWKAAAHCCPYCKAVFSVEIDPIALKNDIINGLMKRLRR